MAPRRKRRTTKKRSAFDGWRGLLVLVAITVVIYLITQGYIDLSRFGIDPEVIGLGPTATPAPPVTGGSGEIQVFFSTPSLIYPDEPRNRVAPPYEQALIADIDAASASVDMAVYEYNLSSISAALVRAQERGVRVRLVLDRENLDDPVMAKWAGAVETAGIPVSWEESDSFMHSKFIIIDGRLLWTGSWNATINDTYRNNNNLLRISVPPLVANYAAEFDRMAAGQFGTQKRGDTPSPQVQAGAATVENYFTPREKAMPRLVGLVGGARQSLDFLAFSFTDDDLAQAMIARMRDGVPVRGVFEKRNAGGVGSEFSRLQEAGVSVYEDGNCYTMHHKVMVIDGRFVVTGSYNFTGRAENVNDENLLIIDDPQLARAYSEEFERVYRQAQSPQRCG